MSQQELSTVQSIGSWRAWSPKPVGELQSSVLRGCFSAWEELRGSAKLPSCDAVTPRYFKAWLTHISLIRVLADGDFEFRLVGDAIAQTYGDVPLRGCKVSDLAADVAGNLRAGYSDLVAKKTPGAYEGWLHYKGDWYYRELLLLPFGSDGESVDHIMSIGVNGEHSLEPPPFVSH